MSAVPAFSQPFTLEPTGGSIDFGAAPLHITVGPVNGTGTKGHLGLTTPPATFSCTPTETVTLVGSGQFAIRGTTTGFGHLWNVDFVFPGPPHGANLGNLDASSTNWELTGKFLVAIHDTITGSSCRNVVATSGEYQFVAAALSGWPHDCSKPTNSNGQSPGLAGSIILRGHAGAFPKFLAGAGCSAVLAAQANTMISGVGFDTAKLDFKLTY